jgi:hypothetical protein
VYAAVLTGAVGTSGPELAVLVDGYAWVFRSAAFGLLAAAPIAWTMIRVDRANFTSREAATHLG